MNDSHDKISERQPDHTSDLDALLDDRLHAFFAERLDPHVGRATVKLCAAAAAPSGRTHRVVHVAVAAIVLLGIGIAIAVMSGAIHTAVTPTATNVPTFVRPPADAIVTKWSETFDAGTVMVEPETPARMLRHVQYEKAEWKDAAGQWRSATSTPKQDVILVDLQKQ